jgi:hypothetical protein
MRFVVRRVALKNSVVATLFCALSLAVAPNAVAQEYSPNLTDYVGIQLSAVPFDITVRNIENSLASRSKSSTPNQPSVSASKALTTFIPSVARTRQNLANFVSKTRGADPQGAAKMEALFASTDVIGMVGKGIAPYGLKTNNVADAYAVYWISAWEASRGIVGASETRQRAQAVRAQAERGLVSSPQFARATEAQKQEFAEAMLVQAAMISSHMEAAADDSNQLRAVSAAVLKGAKASGLDLKAMELTQQGFASVKGRKRSDAGGGVGSKSNGDAVGKKG